MTASTARPSRSAAEGDLCDEDRRRQRRVIDRRQAAGGGHRDQQLGLFAAPAGELAGQSRGRRGRQLHHGAFITYRTSGHHGEE
jgi:hypothetical protein